MIESQINEYCCHTVGNQRYRLCVCVCVCVKTPLIVETNKRHKHTCDMLTVEWLKSNICKCDLQCAVHGEQYIMFSNSQRNMLCVNCFRDTPAEARLHCVDIDTAYTQCSKKLERSVMVIYFYFMYVCMCVSYNSYICVLTASKYSF